MNVTTLMMENLPDELIMMIFNYISALELSLVMSRVCKKWNSIINSRIIRIKRAEHYKKLHRGLQVILVTDADSSIQKSEILISYAIRLTPRLRELTINSDFPLDKNSFKSLSLLVHLRHLDVFAKKQFLNRDTHINQGINSLIINETISSAFLPNLRQNKISSFHMYGRADHFIPREMDCFLTIHAAQLRDLTLRCSEMTDARFRVLTRCVNLLSLQLYMCPMLTKHGIMPIVNLPALQRLHLTGAILLRSRGLQELIKRLPPRVLDLNLSGSHFDSSHCGALAGRLPRLRALELWCARLRRAALLQLARRLPALARLDTDVELKLAHIQELERHPALTRLRCRWKGTVSCRVMEPQETSHSPNRSISNIATINIIHYSVTILLRYLPLLLLYWMYLSVLPPYDFIPFWLAQRYLMTEYEIKPGRNYIPITYPIYPVVMVICCVHV